MSENSESPQPRKFTRRSFLQKAAIATVAATAGNLVNLWPDSNPQLQQQSIPASAPLPVQPPEAAKITPVQPALPAGGPVRPAGGPALAQIPPAVSKTEPDLSTFVKVTIVDSLPEIPGYKQFINEILHLPPQSAERLAKEKEYAETAATKEEIDWGLCIISNFDLRHGLLTKRWQLRTKEGSGLALPDNAQIQWCKDHKIHPETLAAALDAYETARRLLGADEIKLINPGGMAALIVTETGIGVQFQFPQEKSHNLVSLGFVNIGAKPAIQTFRYLSPDIKGVDVELEIQALRTLCAKLFEKHQIRFVPEQIVGSTAGAIGLQFMPSKALEIYQALQQKGYSFNPFDVNSSVVGAWYFLVTRGYQKGDKLKILNALSGWNPNNKQINHIYKLALDFSNKFSTSLPTP